MDEGRLDNRLDVGEAPPAVKCLMIGKSQSLATAGQINLSWKVPRGYKRCTGIYFNPEPGREVIFSLYSENVVYNIVQNASTAVGSAVGFINPKHEYAEKDQISLTGTGQNITGGPVVITFTLQFEVD